MTITCPRGHQSATTDYCDQCGARIEGLDEVEAVDLEAVEPDPSTATQRRAPKPPPGEPCPHCKTPRTPGDRYCEVDGYDFEAQGATWCAIVSADRAFFAATAPDDLVFPADASTRTFTLEGDVISIGRRSHRDGTLPDIDLGEPPEDPGVSREHARLVRIHDDRYSLVDCGSANGTYLNEDRVRLPVDAPVPLADGDRIRLGAWTSIVIAYRTATGSDTS